MESLGDTQGGRPHQAQLSHRRRKPPHSCQSLQSQAWWWPAIPAAGTPAPKKHNQMQMHCVWVQPTAVHLGSTGDINHRKL